MLGSIRIVCGLLLFWTGAAWAGAPAPIPAIAGPHPEHQVANLGDFKFESGDVVKDFKVSYVTHGKLNKAKNNAILVMQAFLGDHHMHDFLIGPARRWIQKSTSSSQPTCWATRGWCRASPRAPPTAG